MIATCGSDRLVMLWDMKKLNAPIATNNRINYSKAYNNSL